METVVMYKRRETTNAACTMLGLLVGSISPQLAFLVHTGLTEDVANPSAPLPRLGYASPDPAFDREHGGVWLQGRT